MKKITTEQLEIEIIKRELADMKKNVDNLSGNVNNISLWSTNISFLVVSLLIVTALTTFFLVYWS